MIKENIVKYLIYYILIIVGLAMVISTSLKLSGIIDFSSDWLWLLAAVGLIAEATISIIKQKKFDRKFKIIERSDINYYDKE